MRWKSSLIAVAVCANVVGSAGFAGAQTQTPPAPAEQPHVHDPSMHGPSTGWQFLQDGLARVMFNRQGGERGSREWPVTNWWMGTASRAFGSESLTLSAMFSVDPMSVGRDGYAEIFQVGEVLDGEPLIDRQHPHDFFMQLSAAWNVRLSGRTTLTLAGGPSGEPSIGPVAFMHRPSAAAIPLAPLSHHIFDSTHVSFGVATAAVEHGRWFVESSIFNGHEPDENRWDFDFGPPDSYAGRVSFRPSSTWELQASSARLSEPEALEEGDDVRTTASAAWTRLAGEEIDALIAAYGVSASGHGTRHAALGEWTRARGRYTLSSRLEVVQVETALLLGTPTATDDAAVFDTVGAVTFGATARLGRRWGLESAIGAAVTAYAVPGALESTHGAHPLSFQVFLDLRPLAGAMGRMWNMQMSRPHRHR